ncbi:MAG: putative aminodeoxychorismate lyase [Bacteroidota bacterium]|jgi:UPF0755 protein
MKNYLKHNKKVATAVVAATLFVAFAILSCILTLTPLNSNGKEFSIFIATNNTGASVEQTILDSLYINAQTPSIIYYKWKVTSFFKSVDKFPPGKYTLNGNSSARAIFNKLLSGNQNAVSIRIDNVKTIYNLAQKFGKKFEQDSAKFMSYVNKNLDLLAPNTKELPLEIRQQRVLERLLGDTYEMYWTSSPENFFSRLNTLYEEYWTNEQDTLASRIGLSEHEVYVLASIVRGETANKDEASQIAGLYLNRLNQEMLLQSDPTVLFGINTKEKRQRVRHDDLKFDSPYNTYLYKGLPPATIHIVEKSYINAVLNAATHNYIFMCAQPGGTGKHNFAVTYAEHKEYARTYQQYLDSLDIQR